MDTTLPIRKKAPTPDEYILALVRSFPCLAIKVRRWLDHTTEFDADEFHQLFDCASSGEVLCALFILNVWNPGYADLKGWKFDLIDFIGSADDGNRRALLNWIAQPHWP